MRNSQTIIDSILTNKPLDFQKTHVVETGLSDYHKMISKYFKACSSKLKTKVISYRSYKKKSKFSVSKTQFPKAKKVSKKQILTFSKTTLIRTTNF